jgi:cysteinyl-tRNA synthetase, unknown class
VDKVLAAGYDGVYLDIVDAYEYWQHGGPGSPDRATTEREMVDFVKGIASRARTTDPDFGVFVQNAEDLSSHPDYGAAVGASARRISSTTATSVSPGRRPPAPRAGSTNSRQPARRCR